jgi:hypothetical protein
MGAARVRACWKDDAMKYGLAWLVGVPFSLVFLWFVMNQVACGR